MLSIKLLHVGSEGYYLDLAAEDYYFNGGEPAGIWTGGAIAFFKLDSRVKRKPFQDLFNGYYPTNNDDPDAPDLIPLVQGAGSESHVAGWDHTFSAPKSWGIIWSQADPELRQRMEEDLQTAVEKTLAFAEREMAFSRTGRGGRGKLVKVKIAVATFQHGTSRALEPQPHIHSVMMNVGVDAAAADKTPEDPSDIHGLQGQVTRTLYSKPFFINKMLLGAHFRAHLAHLGEVNQRFRSERRGTVFEVKGVPQDVMDQQSTRRKEVLAELKQKGQAGGKAAAKAAVDTRRKKDEVPPREQLFERWQQENASLGFTARSVDKLRANKPRDTRRYIPVILRLATNNVTASRNHFSAHDLLKEALYAAVEFGTSPDDIVPAIKDHLYNLEEIVPIPTRYGDQRYTTPKILEEELSMLQALRPNYHRKGAVLNNEIVEAAIAKTQQEMAAKGHRLSREQINAIKHLTQTPHAIRIVQGLAGVGKTSAMLRPTIQAFRSADYKVLGAAYTATAARTLHKETEIKCETIHKCLVDFELSWIKPILHHGRQLVRAARHKKTWKHKKLKPIPMDAKTVVIIDEAGMVNCRHYRLFLEQAQKAGATLLFVGDYRQLGSIEGTSPFRSLMQRVGYAEVTTIQRQKDDWAKQAARYFSQGHVATAMNMYAMRHLLKVGTDFDHALDQVVAEWGHHALERPEIARVLTCTNDQAHEVNLRCQEARLAVGLAAGMHHTNYSRTITDYDKKTKRKYSSKVYVGDRVVFTENNEKLGVINSDTGTVIGFSGAGRLMVQIDDEEEPVIVPTSFEHIRLGYAMTTHRAQGKTFELSFVLLAGTTMDMPTSYVQGTRSKLATHFFTTEDLWHELQELEESPLISLMRREVELALATDLYVHPVGTSDNRDQLVKQLLDKWKQAEGTSVIVAPTEEEAQALNEQCHAIRLAQAQVEWERKRRAKGDQDVPTIKVHGTTLVEGDRIRFTQDSLRTGILEEDLATVVGISPDGTSYDVQLDRHKDSQKKITQSAEESLKIKRADALAYEQLELQRRQDEFERKRREEIQRQAVSNALLLQPSRCNSQPASPVSEYINFDWTPTPTATIFNSNGPNFTNSSGQPVFQSAQSTSFELASTHAAADHHRRMHEANQQTSWYQQQAQALTMMGQEIARTETHTHEVR